ncbi:MAG: rhomboid family intramembrane serine protease [Acidobacteriaceae bacterium]
MNASWQSAEDHPQQTARTPRTHGEVLPPIGADSTNEYGYQSYQFEPPPPPRERSGWHWSYAPATYVLVGINCLVYVFMVLNGVSALSPTALDILHWGANRGFNVLNGEWWRLLTATFVHVGLLHLATNMWCLWNLGLLGEPLMGPIGVLAVYMLTGIAGNLLSTAVNPNIVGAGASGAVFGIAGILIVLLSSKQLPIPQFELKRLRKSVIWFAVLNFVIGGSTIFINTGIRIDNMAHLGGFLSGLALGVPLMPRMTAGRQRYLRRQYISFAVAAVLLSLFGFAIANFYAV